METKLAFTIVIHDQLGLFEILLHTIFRPYNHYCIHIDANAAEDYRKSVEKLINCYTILYPDANIFLATNAIAVKWGTWSVVEADLVCMEQLLKLETQYVCLKITKVKRF